MKVSVIVPTYNCGTWLAECLQSVLKQSQRPDEIIVIDDGSTDNTVEIVQKYLPEIMFIQQENQGQAAARNNAAAKATGDWLAFLDADDVWLPHKMERQLEYLRQNPRFSMIVSDMFEGADPESKTKSLFSKFADIEEGKIFGRLLRSSYIFPSTMLIKKSVFDQYDGFDNSLRFMEDTDLYMKIARDHEIGVIKEQLVFRRRHSTSISKNDGALLMKANFYPSAEERFGPFTPEERALIQLHWLESTFAAGYESLLLGKQSLALSCFWRCLSHRYRVVTSLRCLVAALMPFSLFQRLRPAISVVKARVSGSPSSSAKIDR